jgi:DNA-directed RNA polymerase subunit F
MSKPEILEKTPLSMTQLKAELSNISKRDKEPGFRTTKTLEYIGSFSTLSAVDFAALKKSIEKLNVPRLKEEHIVKLLDILPKTPAEVGVVLQGYAVTVSKENMKAIADVVAEYKEK